VGNKAVGMFRWKMQRDRFNSATGTIWPAKDDLKREEERRAENERVVGKAFHEDIKIAVS